MNGEQMNKFSCGFIYRPTRFILLLMNTIVKKALAALKEPDKE